MIKEIDRSQALDQQLSLYAGIDRGRYFGEGPMHEEIARLKLEFALAHFGNLNGGKVLDIACGEGEVVQALEQRGIKSVGLDYIPTIASDMTNSVNNFVIALAQELPFANNEFDGASAFDVFEALTKNDQSMMLGEVFRVLKPGGKFILATPNSKDLYARFAQLISINPSPKPGHTNPVDLWDLTTLFREAGFNIDNLFGVGIIPGMYRLQYIFPSRKIHSWNLQFGRNYPDIASWIYAVASKPLGNLT